MISQEERGNANSIDLFRKDYAAHMKEHVYNDVLRKEINSTTEEFVKSTKNRQKRREILTLGRIAKSAIQPYEDYNVTAFTQQFSDWNPEMSSNKQIDSSTHLNMIIFCSHRIRDIFKLKNLIFESMANHVAQTEYKLFVAKPVTDLRIHMNAILRKYMAENRMEYFFEDVWRMVGKLLKVIISDAIDHFLDIYDFLYKNISTNCIDPEKSKQIRTLEKSNVELSELRKLVKKRIENLPAELSRLLTREGNDDIAEFAAEINSLYLKWANSINATVEKLTNYMIKQFAKYLPEPHQNSSSALPII